MSISVSIQGGAGISASVTTKQVVSQTLQVVWDVSTDPDKNTFVDANEAEILTFTDNALPISVGASGIFDIYETLADGLTNEEKYLMTVFLDREIANGNQSLEDYHSIITLSGSNALVDYIGGKVANPVNNPTFDKFGVHFDGATNYLDTNWKNSDAINFVQNNAMMGAFIYAFTNGTNKVAFGVFDGTNQNILFSPASNSKRSQIMNKRADVNGQGGIVAKSLNVGSSDGSIGKYYENGIDITTVTTGTAGTPTTHNTFIGARNNQNTADLFSASTISSFVIGAQVGFSQTEYNTNLRALLTGLGTLP